MNREEFESKLDGLIGQRIRAVHYLELDYGDGEPWWNSDPRFDSLDWGIQLSFESGREFNLTWGDEFYCWGLSFDENPARGEGQRSWEVTHASRWASLIGTPIVRATLFWSWFEDPDRNRSYYPQDLALDFQGGRRVYLCAFEYLSETRYYWAMDNITIVFDEDVARKYRLGPYSQESER